MFRHCQFPAQNPQAQRDEAAGYLPTSLRIEPLPARPINSILQAAQYRSFIGVAPLVFQTVLEHVCLRHTSVRIEPDVELLLSSALSDATSASVILAAVKSQL
jgi:hypothetical protein